QHLVHLTEKKRHQLWFLKKTEAEHELNRIREEGLHALTNLEQRSAHLRHAEARLEELRLLHADTHTQVNEAQGALYQVSADVGKLEAEIRLVLDHRRRIEQSLIELRSQYQHWRERESQSTHELSDLDTQIEQALEQVELYQARVEAYADQLPDLEQAQDQAQEALQQQRQQVNEVQQSIRVLSAEQRGLGEQLRQLQQRDQRLQQTRRGLPQPDTSQLPLLTERLTLLRAQAKDAAARVIALQTQLPLAEDERRAAQQGLNEALAALAQCTAKRDALRQLQEQVQVSAELRPWLHKQGLETLQALWQRLHVQPEWSVALESALRERLHALEVHHLDAVAGLESDAPSARLVFMSLPSSPPQALTVAHPAQSLGLPTLASVVQSHHEGLAFLLSEWLSTVFIASSLRKALEYRPLLTPHQRIVTPAGHSVTRYSVDFYAPDAAQAGLLTRAQDIADLEKALKAHTLIAEQARARLYQAETRLRQCQNELDAARQQAQAKQQQCHAIEVEHLRLQQQIEQATLQAQRLEEEWAEIAMQQEELQARLAEAEARFESLDAALAQQQDSLMQTEDHAHEQQQQLSRAKEQARQLEREAQESLFIQRSLEAKRAELQRGIHTALQQQARVQDELHRQQTDWEQLSDETAQAGLQAAVARRLACEQHLSNARSAYDELSAELRQSEEERLRLSRDLEPARQRISDLQLKEQAARLIADQHQQWLTEAGQGDEASLSALAKEMTAESMPLKPNALQNDIERLQRAIQALGAVNLAALDELSAAKDRYGFLQAQSTDLSTAINTLEDAIRKIDAETRSLLGVTFDEVNAHFGRLFPELFGGGQAQLLMTGAEVLDAGVQVMAQPPGKKNQTIHLLSGGEKALTAIALVFAIFLLNPAPFCLLDEVDAPLDDVNTARYAKLVTHMSSNTQFLFISHNKIAMAMAQQLIGVTMQEQGVSRIVTVDMETAIDLTGNENTRVICNLA
ncbi:MAG: chromosome segregation protein, partial [Pseudomonadota bacterium]